MSRSRAITYMIGGLFFFSTVFTFAYLFIPEFREGGHIFAGVILSQFVAVLVALVAKEITEAGPPSKVLVSKKKKANLGEKIGYYEEDQVEEED